MYRQVTPQWGKSQITNTKITLPVSYLSKNYIVVFGWEQSGSVQNAMTSEKTNTYFQAATYNYYGNIGQSNYGWIAFGY